MPGSRSAQEVWAVAVTLPITSRDILVKMMGIGRGKIMMFFSQLNSSADI